MSKFAKVYPGSDEIGFTLLSKFSVDTVAQKDPPLLQVIYRNDSTKNYVPIYEQLPMNETLSIQLESAGGVQWNSSFEHEPQATLLVNNFQVQPQVEAPNQQTTGRSISDYDKFLPYVCPNDDSARFPEGRNRLNTTTTSIIGFVDNRYSNGADILFVDFIRSLSTNSSCGSQGHGSGLDMKRFAYAGWNTDGNTLGCSIANTILLHLFTSHGTERQPSEAAPISQISQSINCTGGCANTYFNTLRLVEDCYYQAVLRGELQVYIDQVNGETNNTLYKDLNFYERYSYKVLASRTENVASQFGLPWQLGSVYYPWNRTFEIGLIGVNGSHSRYQVRPQFLPEDH